MPIAAELRWTLVADRMGRHGGIHCLAQHQPARLEQPNMFLELV